MIKAIFFDLYGTLAGFSPSRFEIQSQACAQFNITLTEEGVLKGYKKADEYMTNQNASYPIRNRAPQEIDDFFSKYESLVLEGCEINVDLDIAASIWKEIRKIPYEMKIFDDVIESLKNLRYKNFRLGVLSNINKPGAELLKEFGLTDYIDFSVTSYEVGSEKPHPPIFEEALRRARVKNNEVFHIGDQIGSDIEGAENVGIYPILMDRDNNYENWDVNRCLRVANMLALENIFNDLGREI